MLIQLEIGAYPKKERHFFMSMLLGQTYKGREPVKTSVSYVCRSSKFNLSYIASYKQVRWTEKQEEITSCRNIFSSEATNLARRVRVYDPPPPVKKCTLF